MPRISSRVVDPPAAGTLNRSRRCILRWVVLLAVLRPASCIAPLLVPLAHAGAAVAASFHATAVASFHASGFLHAMGCSLPHLGAAHAAGAAGAAGAGGATVAHAAGVATALGSGAATGAATTAIASPDRVVAALTDSLRDPSKPPSAQAVGRILQIEWDRLCAVAAQGSRDPRHVFRRVQEKVNERKPIITWALDLWPSADQCRMVHGHGR